MTARDGEWLAHESASKEGHTGLRSRVVAVLPRAAIERVHDLCLLYTSDAADERSSVDLGGRRIIKKKTTQQQQQQQAHQPVRHSRVNPTIHMLHISVLPLIITQVRVHTTTTPPM